MGAFCVFGVSRQACRKLAEKGVSTFDKATGRALTAPEWGALVKVAGDRLFGETMKEGRISPELDTPQFCRDWIAAQPGEVRLTRLMCRAPKIDKHGAPVIRKGVQVLSWQPYDEATAWPRPFGESAIAVARELEAA